jgi:pyruvate dehydrogenase E2 component (dihydrolipoamide acetyltransferase)
VSAGEVAPVGAVVAVIQGKGETAASAQPAPKTAPPPARVASPAPAAAISQHAIKPTTQMEPFREVRSPERNYGPARLAGGTVTTPLARRLAGEAGIDLTNVKGSGPHGRIVARDVETAQTAKPAAPALAHMQAMASLVLTADIALGQSLALCADVKAIELADVIVKAWATALRHAVSDAPTDIALAAGEAPALIRDAAARSLTAIAAARRETITAADAQRASSAVFIAQVPGIASVSHAVRPPQVTMLSIGSRRRAPVEEPNGLVAFADIVTATLACDPGAVNAALGAALLSAFKGFVEQPVKMIV